MSARRVLVPVALVLGMVLAACGDGDGSTSADSPDGRRVQVVTTVAPITSLVATLAGDRADVRGIVPEGTNSHTFEPPPSVAEALAGADIVFVNGLGLEQPTLELAEATMADDTRLVALGDAVLDEQEWVFDFSFPESEGLPNPHAWTDPTLAREYAGVIRDTLVDVDPDGAAAYDANHDAVVDRIDALHAAMEQAVATVDPARRLLLTYHDSFPYMSRTYGFTVIGAIQPRDFGEPSAREVARLIDQVREVGVPAIFGSEVFPSPVLEQIGRETGVRYVDVLRDDDLPGEPGDPEHSYLGLMRFDFVTIVEALGGDATALHALDITVPVDDTARYPQ